jgi:hypothetical protein
MRLIGAASIACLLAIVFAIADVELMPAFVAAASAGQGHDARKLHEGRSIFRYDTFGDEQLWTDTLRMHDAIATVPPATALAVGLKVDVDALPRSLIEALREGTVNLNDPAVTVELLRLEAVVGVRGQVNAAGQLTKVGVRARCATRRWTIRSHRESAGASTAGRTPT